MLEEPSMKAFLDNLLPRLFPALEFVCIPHEGKSDLEQSLPRKLKAWTRAGDRFVVLRDNDGADCKERKAKLAAISQTSGRPDTLVRIVCQELEAWYFGDISAMALAFQNAQLSAISKRRRYRDPDQIVKPSSAIASLHPPFQKIDGARRMGAHVNYRNNDSRSFRVFIEGIARITALALPA